MAYSRHFIKIQMYYTSLSTFTRTATFILLVAMVIICTAAVKLDWESMSFYMKFPGHTSIDAPRRNINIPWPTKGMGDADYMLAFQHVVMPVAYEFDPDLVISECFSSRNLFVLSKKPQSPLDSTLLKATNWVVASSHQRVMLK